MSPEVLHWLVPAAFGMHGLGMLGAAAYAPFDKSGGFIGPSWLLGRGAPAIELAVLVWAVAGVGFLAAAAGFWQQAEWWRSAAWIGSVGTMTAVGLWAGAFPPGVYAGGVLAAGTIVYLLR